MSEWHDIETAPPAAEDVQLHVLVTGGVHGREVVSVLADGEWWRMRMREGSKTQPTHWMPLPEPPS
jgi:hypothetical protein